MLSSTPIAKGGEFHEEIAPIGINTDMAERLFGHPAVARMWNRASREV